MCPNDAQSRRSRRLYDSAAGSDVRFLVGPAELLFPGHRSILAGRNPVFKAMFEGGFEVPLPPDHIPIPDVDDRAFDNLLRFLYGHEVVLQSVPTALLTLYAGYKYLCPDLVTQCVGYLDAHTDAASVLLILNECRRYTEAGAAPSAPPPDAEARPPVEPQEMPTCDRLVHNALNFVDRHADEVLAQEALEDLDAGGLEAVLGRDTLAVTSEAVVFDALLRWSSRECKRRRLQLTAEGRRRVLEDAGDALYLARYLRMTAQQFLRGPHDSQVMAREEADAILRAIVDRPPPEELPEMLGERWEAMDRPRVSPTAGDFALSGRTAGPPAPAAHGAPSDAPACPAPGKKEKKKRPKSSSSPGREKRSAGSKIAECLCGAIACILD